MTSPNRKPGFDPLFRPRAIAVIGASRSPNRIGHEIVRNLVEGGFCGPVYPVNPSTDVVHSMPCFPNVGAIPGPVDLAVIVVPARHVLKAAQDCARKGVKALVVISSGFAETGPEGTGLQEKLVAHCRKNRIRMVGPNCMGVLNTDPEVSMNATFAATTPTSGGAAFLSQSGALGEAILADARSLGLGVSMFASIGNRAEVSPSDFLEYWEKDPRTCQILLYLEAFGHPERFMSIARRLTRKKPVMVVKSGRTASGARAAVSHTGSLAGSEAAIDSLFAQCGVLRVDSMKELFLHASAAQTGKLPLGRHLAIVTNAGGPGILATDACVGRGLVIAPLQPATQKKLRTFLPKEASVTNPVDLTAGGDAEGFDKALSAVIADRGVDMILAMFVSPIMIDSAAVARVFIRHARRTRKPLLTCLLGRDQGTEAESLLREAGVPNYRFPEEAAVALSGLHRLRILRERPEEPAPSFRADRPAARGIVEKAVRAGRPVLSGDEVDSLLAAYRIPVAPSRVVTRSSEALEAAGEFGWPVVLKLEARGIAHKTDMGGVFLDLRGADELLKAWAELDKRFRKRLTGWKVRVQPMKKGGVEVFFGAATDPRMGRMMAFGIGGIHVEVFKDIVFRLHPLSRTDAEEMVAGIRAQALLDGVRGQPGVVRDQLVEVLLRLNRLLADSPEIAELDLNPFLAAPSRERSFVLDARVRLKDLKDSS